MVEDDITNIFDLVVYLGWYVIDLCSEFPKGIGRSYRGDRNSYPAPRNNFKLCRQFKLISRGIPKTPVVCEGRLFAGIPLEAESSVVWSSEISLPYLAIREDFRFRIFAFVNWVGNFFDPIWWIMTHLRVLWGFQKRIFAIKLHALFAASPGWLCVKRLYPTFGKDMENAKMNSGRRATSGDVKHQSGNCLANCNIESTEGRNPNHNFMGYYDHTKNVSITSAVKDKACWNTGPGNWNEELQNCGHKIRALSRYRVSEPSI